MAFSMADLVVCPVVNMAPSSTYIVRSWCLHVVAISNKLAVYNADSIGERGDPWGVPLWIGKGPDVWLPMRRVACHPVMNNLTH
jgi:hypothetical protein